MMWKFYREKLRRSIIETRKGRWYVCDLDETMHVLFAHKDTDDTTDVVIRTALRHDEVTDEFFDGCKLKYVNGTIVSWKVTYAKPAKKKGGK